uniref:Dynein light chain roadblock-type 1 n=1 Tax=Laticauda laticaudata TaxID=8630 RepID=A0A8C5RZ45_LATLA
RAWRAQARKPFRDSAAEPADDPRFKEKAPDCFLSCKDGIPIKSTLDNSSTVQYAGLMHNLIMKARGTVRDIDPQNDLTFLRIRSKKNEIMVAPDKDYFLIVIQNPTE